MMLEKRREAFRCVMQKSGLYGILICSVTATVNFRIILAEMPLDVVIAL